MMVMAVTGDSALGGDVVKLPLLPLLVCAQQVKDEIAEFCIR